MKQDHFTRRHRREWAAFAEQLDRLDGRRDRPAELDEFPGRYRRLCQHYALARARAYSPTVTERLHRLVLRAHQAFYAPRRLHGERVLEFLLDDYPRLVRREWRFLCAAVVVFFGGLLALMFGVQAFPDLVYTVLDGHTVRAIEAMYDPDLELRFGRERQSESDFMMFGYYLRNNTSIGFQTFAGGLLFGLGTLFYLLFNGVYIGAIAGHLVEIGYGTTFWSFVSGHSAFELTAIVLSGAAGFRLGWAALVPGRNTRPRALREAAVVGVRLVYGAAALFLLAAFVEAFWSSRVDLAPAVKYGFGLLLWLLVLTYIFALGKSR